MPWHAGCLQPTAFPKELSQLIARTGEMISDQGVLDTFKTDLDGHVQDPGVETYVEIRVAAGGRLVGVNGNLDVNAGGGATHLPSGLRESLIGQLDGPIGDEQRLAILSILGWNRTAPPEASHAPPTTGP